MGNKKEKLRDFAFEMVMDGMVSVPKLLLKYYAKLGMDAQELVLTLQLLTARQVQNQCYPELSTLAEDMQISIDEVKLVIAGLLEKKLIQIIEIDEAKQYSLSPIFEGLTALWYMDKESKHSTHVRAQTAPSFNDKVEVKTVCRAFEEDFGRLLSPLEVETIRNWLYKRRISPSVLGEALKIATLRGIKNVQYIDKILVDWQNQGLHDVKSVRNYIENRNPIKRTKKIAPSIGSSEPQHEQEAGREQDIFDIWYSG